MGSNQKQIRQRQKEAFEQQLAALKAELADKGVDEKGLKKDKSVQRLEAEIKRSRKAIESIEAQGKILSAARDKKQATAEAKAAAGPKKKNQKEDEAAKAEGGKKKKKAKKEKKD